MVSALLFRRCCRRLSCHRRTLLNKGCALPLQSSSATEPKRCQPGADILLPREDGGAFSGDCGFWPQKQEPGPFLYKNARLVVISQEEEHPKEQEALNSPTPTIPSHLTPKARPRKIVVSQLGSKAARAKRWGPFKIPSRFFRPSFQSNAPAFRSNQGLRSILAVYVNSLAPLLPALDRSATNVQGLAPLDRQLLSVFSENVVNFLATKGHEPADVISWAWIFDSDTTTQSVGRFVALADELRKQNRPNIPRFVALQLLRAESMNATSLQTLLSSLRRSANQHPLHVVEADGTSIIDIEQAMATAWDHSSAMILAVRLLRHARLVSPDMFDDIIELACMMLFSIRDKIEGFGRLTYMCNRLLTLISLPTSVRSRRSVREQQKAQLSLLRRMFAQKPQVPITREGYRALIKLQLIHEKTEEEKEWAGAKSESWPPWRKSKVGIEDKREYPGRESRAMKMLRRMAEAGYAHQAWEKAAAILAGWDTDKSPTIQSRAVLDMPPMAAFVSLFDDVGDDSPYVTAQLWTARIVATRSVREAWACFAEYRQTIKDADKRIDPYHAMFEKLLARPRQADTRDNNVLPGDAKETWLDPVSDRDLVYLKKEVPSNEDFYALMITDGVRPAGRLLTLLVRNAKTLDDGIQYLESSTYTELKKDVLLHSLKYPDLVIRDTISSVPNHFFAAFLGLLSRVYDLDIMTTTYVAYSSNQWKSPTGKLLKPEEYALDLLFASETTYVPAYNAILEGVYLRLEKRKLQPEQTRRSLRPRMIFQIALIVLNHMAKRDIQPDLTTFHRFGSILRLCLKPPVIWSPSSEMALREVKRVFTFVVYGTHRHTWLPTTSTDRIITPPDPEHLRLLIEILGIEQDIAGLFELTEWMSQHRERLQENYAEVASGEESMKKALFGLRVFLEGAWANDFDWDMGISVATEEQIAQTAEKVQPLGWPTSEEMADFVAVNYSWLEWLRKAVWHRRNVAEEATATSKEADKADLKTSVSSEEADLEHGRPAS